MFDKLATIQTIKSIEPIEGADAIELARFNETAWQSVVKKNDFVVGQKIIYIQIDTVLPGDAAWSQFLKAKTPVGEPVRLRTVRLRGALSQGLVLPLSVLGVCFSESLEVGTDVAAIIGVTKYEKPMPASSEAKGNFPSFILKTDEPRIQNYPKALEWFRGREVEIRLKMDGTSATYFKRDGVFGVCSRNMELKENAESVYWQIARRFDLEELLPENSYIQGEICGPGIQGNPVGLDQPCLFPFNAARLSLGSPTFFDVSNCTNWFLMPPPLIWDGEFNFSLEELLNLAREQRYFGKGNQIAEGIVVRAKNYNLEHPLLGRPSFKVINDKYKD